MGLGALPLHKAYVCVCLSTCMCVEWAVGDPIAVMEELREFQRLQFEEQVP